MKTNYVVYFDDGTMLGENRRIVREFPEAKQFTSKRKAEEAARAVNKPSTVEPVTP